MEIFVVVVIFLVFYLISSFHGGGNTYGGRVNAMFRRLGKRYQGRLIGGGLFRRPSLRFFYGDAICQITHHRDRNAYLDVRLSWPDTNWGFEMLTRTGAAESVIPRNPRTLGVQAEFLSFEDQFSFSTNDPESLRTWLSPEVKLAIRRFLFTGGNQSIDLSLHNGTLLLRGYGTLISSDDLSMRVHNALAIFDLARVATMQGIDWMAPTKDSENTVAICKICGELIIQNAVTCRSCLTPHHYDCWVYNGACSTYGCQETGFVRRSAVQAE